MKADNRTTQANARLIAAAPDLLSAAVAARDCLDRIKDSLPPADPRLRSGSLLNATITQLLDAIAKAEGR